jgi:hypothetical protein
MSREEDQKLPRYIRDALDALNGEDIRPGYTVVIGVHHDSWCPRLTGGECRCKPTTEVLRSYDGMKEDT